jgi:hypothetical protein
MRRGEPELRRGKPAQRDGMQLDSCMQWDPALAGFIQWDAVRRGRDPRGVVRRPSRPDRDRSVTSVAGIPNPESFVLP